MVDAAELRGHLGDWARADRPLYEALAARLQDLIVGGRLPAGAPLPAQRQLADALAVSRGTVLSAYDRLLERGLAEARQGSGTRVSRGASPTTGPREAHLAANLHEEHIFSGFLHPDEGTIDLRGAYWMGSDDLPDDVFALPDDDAFARLRDSPGYFPLGIPTLRRALADDLTAKGLATTPQQIVVTTGAQQAIDLAANVLLAPGDDVVVEELTYPGAIDAVLARQARLHPVRLTPDGVDVDDLNRTVASVKPRLVYLIPTCHNPTGTLLPASQARRLVELAADWNTVIIDDRSLSDTLLDDRPIPPPLSAHATDQQARQILTIGSLSKSVWGGLRIGFVRAQGPLLDRLARLKAVADLGASVPSQTIAARVLADIDAIIPPRRRALTERHDTLATALAAALPDWSWQPPRGGLCLWVRLPGAASSAEFALTAARHGIGLAPGSASSPTRRHTDHLRIPYGQPPDILWEVAQRLEAAWHDYQGRASALDAPGVVI